MLALYVAGSQFISSVREGGRSGTSSRSSNRMRSALVIAEITVAVFLQVCSGLLLESLKAVERLSTGFDPQGVITATVALPPGGAGGSCAHFISASLVSRAVGIFTSVM